MSDNMAERLRELMAAFGASGAPACDSCDADSELIEVSPGVMLVNILHDDGCPVLARHQP